MSEEEMISEIEIYLSHVVQKDFSLPKAIKMMYEEYKRQEDKEKNWEKIYSEDQNYITELNNKIFELEEKNKKIEDKIKGMYDKSNKLIEVTNLYLNTLSKLERLENKIKEILDKIDVEDYYCLNEAEEDLRKLVE